jgi:hypothetical protein
MSLLQAVQRKAADPHTSAVNRCVLNYLVAHAVGRRNAKPWPVIEAHLRRNGFALSHETFQQGLLKDSRESNYFIGSNDHGVNRGYYIINTQRDAELMRDWYEDRIQKERARLRSLQRQVRPFRWHI